jgi:hypothetical protein
MGTGRSIFCGRTGLKGFAQSWDVGGGAVGTRAATRNCGLQWNPPAAKQFAEKSKNGPVPPAGRRAQDEEIKT